jgi:Tol biopolymer transport system component
MLSSSLARSTLVSAAILVALSMSGPGSPKAAPKVSSPFQPEPTRVPQLLAPGILSTGDDESHAVLSPDGTQLYFLKNSPTFDHWTIVTTQWTGVSWTTPEVAPFSGRWSDADPFLTEDGSKLFFISTRPVDKKTKSDTDLWMAVRTWDGAWGVPVHLGALVNSPESEWFPTVTHDGTLYFGSERTGGKGGADIWRSRRVGGVYQAPENLGEPVNSPAGEFEPMVSPDERFLVFAAVGREGGIGAFDLWISYNEGGRWSEPVLLSPPINTPAWDFAPRLSPDGRVLLFTSSRGRIGRDLERPLRYDELLSKLHAPRNGLRDLYYISSAVLTAPRDSSKGDHSPQ